MIHYQLRCEAAHEFDGWFKDSATFLEHAEGGLITCPHCGSASVARALMAPALPRTPRAADLPDSARAALQRLRGLIEHACEDVGDAFAATARGIHYGEQARRGIYGNASADEVEALREEGIPFGQLPWVPRAES